MSKYYYPPATWRDRVLQIATVFTVALILAPVIVSMWV